MRRSMNKMSVLGNDVDSLIDCSSIITDAFPADSSTVTAAQKGNSANSTVSATASTIVAVSAAAAHMEYITPAIKTALLACLLYAVL
jgi:hypothetical protein